MNEIKPFFALLTTYAVVAACFFGCKTPASEPNAEMKTVAIESAAKNIALILSTPQKLPSSQSSLDRMASALNGELSDLGIKVETAVATSSNDVMARIKSNSALVANDGTLVIAIAALGDSTGAFQMEDGSVLTLDQIGSAVMHARKTPLRRTILILESHLDKGRTMEKEDELRILNTTLMPSINWFESVFGRQQHWMRLVTDKDRWKDSRLSQTVEPGEVLVFASSQGEPSGVVDGFVETMKDLHKDLRRETITLQALADGIRKRTQSAVFAAAPATASKSHVFAASADSSGDVRSKTLGLAWLNQVSKRLNEAFDGCTFGPEYAIDYGNGFLFDPSFIVTSKSGQIFHDQYFGVMNWMSSLEVSVCYIKHIVTDAAAAQYAPMRCTERKDER